MITETRTPTSAELPLPSEHEAERSEWTYYGINWDDVTENESQLLNSLGAVVARQNAITAESDFIEEEGVITAMRLVAARPSIEFFSANANTLKTTPSHTTSAFRVDTYTQINFAEGAIYPFYRFENMAAVELNFSGLTARATGTSDARIVRGPDFDESRDLIQFDAGGQTGSVSDIELYGERHNSFALPQNYITDIPSNTFGTNPFNASGNLRLRDTLRYNTTKAFPFEMQTPTRLYLNSGWRYGAQNVDSEFLQGGVYNAPNNDSALGAQQLHQPLVTGICVRWRGTGARIKSLVRPHGDFVGRAKSQLWQHRLNAHDIWAGELPSGAVYKSENEGGTWQLMANAWTDIEGAKPLGFTALPPKAAISMAKVGGDIKTRYSVDGLTWDDPVTVCAYAEGSWAIMSHEYAGQDDVSVRNEVATAHYKSTESGAEGSWESQS